MLNGEEIEEAGYWRVRKSERLEIGGWEAGKLGEEG